MTDPFAELKAFQRQFTVGAVLEHKTKLLAVKNKISDEELYAAIDTATKKCKNPYAQTYLNAIPAAMEEATYLGQTPTEGLRVQLLYCLNNMQTWRGETARKTKKIINQWIKENDRHN